MSGLINILLDITTVVCLIALIMLVLTLIGWGLFTLISEIKDEIEFRKWERESEDEE